LPANAGPARHTKRQNARSDLSSQRRTEVARIAARSLAFQGPGRRWYRRAVPGPFTWIRHELTGLVAFDLAPNESGLFPNLGFVTGEVDPQSEKRSQIQNRECGGYPEEHAELGAL